MRVVRREEMRGRNRRRGVLLSEGRRLDPGLDEGERGTPSKGPDSRARKRRTAGRLSRGRGTRGERGSWVERGRRGKEGEGLLLVVEDVCLVRGVL
jgi:hypothetical protein